MSKDSLIKLRDRLLVTLSYEDRRWLVGELENADSELVSACPYTKEELDARFDELERDFEIGEFLSADESFHLIAKELGFEQNIERIAV